MKAGWVRPRCFLDEIRRRGGLARAHRACGHRQSWLRPVLVLMVWFLGRAVLVTPATAVAVPSVRSPFRCFPWRRRRCVPAPFAQIRCRRCGGCDLPPVLLAGHANFIRVNATRRANAARPLSDRCHAQGCGPAQNPRPAASHHAPPAALARPRSRRSPCH